MRKEIKEFQAHRVAPQDMGELRKNQERCGERKSGNGGVKETQENSGERRSGNGGVRSPLTKQIDSLRSRLPTYLLEFLGVISWEIRRKEKIKVEKGINLWRGTTESDLRKDSG
jgi:hypothetical protein